MSGTIADTVREAERRARNALEQGCEDDLADVKRFVAGPAAKACNELHDTLSSLGALDVELRKQLVAGAAEQAAALCARRTFSNADVRFRGRFRIYVEALVDAEQQAGYRQVRRIVLPHVVLEDVQSVVPSIEVELDGLHGWMAELRRLVCVALTASVQIAYRLLERRGRACIARGAIAWRLREARLNRVRSGTCHR